MRATCICIVSARRQSKLGCGVSRRSKWLSLLRPNWRGPIAKLAAMWPPATDELISHVERYLKGGRVDQERHKYRTAYVHAWFGPTDGNRCDAAAEAIDTFLAARPVNASSSLGREGVPSAAVGDGDGALCAWHASHRFAPSGRRPREGAGRSGQADHKRRRARL